MFVNLFKSAAFSLQASENIIKPPLNYFKGQVEDHQWMTTRESYVDKPMVKFSGVPWIFFVCKFLKVLIISNKTIHMAFRIHNIVQVKLIRKRFYFTIYPNYALALSACFDLKYFTLKFLFKERSKEDLHEIRLNFVSLIVVVDGWWWWQWWLVGGGGGVAEKECTLSIKRNL